MALEQNNKSRIKGLFYAIIILLFSSVLVFRIVQNYQEEKLLEKSKTTKAVLKRKEFNNTPKSGYSGGVFEFLVDRQKIEFSEKGNFRMLEIGDTVIIKYSMEDNSVADVVDKYYMRKYRTLDNDY